MGGYNITKIGLLVAVPSMVLVIELLNVGMVYCEPGKDSNGVRKDVLQNSVERVCNRLAKDMSNRRLFLEKYFLLVQKRKFQKLSTTNARVIALKKIIDLQLRYVNRALRRNFKFRLNRKFAHLMPHVERE